MKKIIFLCFFVASFLFFIVYNNIQKEDKKLISSGLAEISFSFPSSLEEKIVESSIDVIKKRLAFISHNDQVKIQRNGRDVVFSFVKSDFNDEAELLVLSLELLKNVDLKFYEVLGEDNDKDISEIELRPDNMDNVENGRTLKLLAVSSTPFLTLSSNDISRLYLDKIKVNGDPAFMLRVALKEKSHVLENKTNALARKGGMIYFQFNNGDAGGMYVQQKISDEFSIPVNYEDMAEFLEMQYKYPLPEVVD